mmetsp:Transcript_115086/g.221784  ORF Transcript_115086/g.221784 Transcript_115086/m.221784 type:complete len:271 (+) Transcript_115086:396-1208(+)
MARRCTCQCPTPAMRRVFPMSCCSQKIHRESASPRRKPRVLLLSTSTPIHTSSWLTKCSPIRGCKLYANSATRQPSGFIRKMAMLVLTCRQDSSPLKFSRWRKSFGPPSPTFSVTINWQWHGPTSMTTLISILAWKMKGLPSMRTTLRSLSMCGSLRQSIALVVTAEVSSCTCTRLTWTPERSLHNQSALTLPVADYCTCWTTLPIELWSIEPIVPSFSNQICITRPAVWYSHQVMIRDASTSRCCLAHEVGNVEEGSNLRLYKKLSSEL